MVIQDGNGSSSTREHGLQRTAAVMRRCRAAADMEADTGSGAGMVTKGHMENVMVVDGE